jgi:hypothetical protein
MRSARVHEANATIRGAPQVENGFVFVCVEVVVFSESSVTKMGSFCNFPWLSSPLSASCDGWRAHRALGWQRAVLLK